MKLLFLDTETLGLDPEAPIWEFAAIQHGGPQDGESIEFFIEHDPVGWLGYREDLEADYLRRYEPSEAYPERDAARVVADLMKGSTIIGSNPSFDVERLTKLLQRHGHEPRHHYHLMDVGALLVGHLATRGGLPPWPWKTDHLSALAGIDPAMYARHTAMGDVEWTQDIWNLIVGDA